VYRFCAWTRDNDLIDAGKQIQEEKAQKRRQATAFNPGDRVRFVSGLFTGKLGVVQETDTKAQVKVRVGKMSVVVAGSELTPAP
jgi:transcription antitermination factor NusG